MKKINLLIFSLLISVLFVTNVKAANANISVYADKSLVVVGDTVNITVKLSSGSNLGSWNFDVVPSSNLQLVSSSFGGLYIKDVVHTKGEKSKTYTFRFRAKSSGTGAVSIKNARVIDYGEANMSVYSGSTSFRMMTRSELEATYSKNNNLKSLSVDGHKFDKEFNKNTLEYNLELEYGTKNINLRAALEDNRATVSGLGEKSLSQGLNVLKVIVTAQNGSSKTYTINATVKELDPINVSLDGKQYTVIREKQFLPEVNMYFQDTIVKIDGKDVPAYKNDVSEYILVGLKNDKGDTNLYIYKDDKFVLYKDIKFNSLVIQLLDMPNDIVPKGYSEDSIKIGEENIKAYINPSFDFPVVYGLNLETGEKNLYKYDVKENTLQRYEGIKGENEKIYFNMMLGMGGFIIISYILFIYKSKKYKHSFITDSINMNIENISADPINEVLNIKTKKELRREKKLRKKNKQKVVEDDNEKMADL